MVTSGVHKPLEPSHALPVGHRRLERGQLDVGRVDVVRDDLVAEGGAGHDAGGEQVPGVAQRGRQARLVVGQVGVARVGRLELETVLDAVQAGGDDRAQRQVRVEVRAAGAVLEAQPGPWPTTRSAAGAVVVRPGDRGGGERARGIALVGVDVGRQQQRQLAQAGQLAGQERLEHRPVAREQHALSSAESEKWMWHELPSRSLNLAMKLIAIPSWAAISLAPFL